MSKKTKSILSAMIVVWVLFVVLFGVGMGVAFDTLNIGTRTYETSDSVRIFSDGVESVGNIDFILNFNLVEKSAITYRVETEDSSATCFMSAIWDDDIFIILGDRREFAGLEELELMTEEYKEMTPAEKREFLSNHAYGKISGYEVRIENTQILKQLLIQEVDDEDLLNTLNNIGSPIRFYSQYYIDKLVFFFSIDLVLLISGIVLTVVFVKKVKSEKTA